MDILVKHKTIITSTISIIILLTLWSCQRYKRDKITIMPTKYETSLHLGYGVWMTVPEEYHQAKSYAGVQTSEANSSIHVELKMVDLDDFKNTFKPAKLARKRTKLIELSKVKFKDNEEAFFSVVEDHRKQTVRYLLAIAKQDTVYAIQAFCYLRELAQFDQKIRKAFYTTFIGNVPDYQNLFDLFGFDGENGMIYTRNGKDPAETKDQSVVIIYSLDVVKKSPEELMNAEMFSLSGFSKTPIGKANVENGKFYKSARDTGTKKAMVFFIENENGDRYLISCKGNEFSSLSDFERYVANNFLVYERRESD